jgi:hypothetical protein
MNRHHALRFLLLKHLWKLRAHVPAERHRSIARSLEVEKTATSWIVSWTDRGERKTFEMALDDVALYVRGDLGTKAPPGSDARNEVLGERFARQALDITGSAAHQTSSSRVERLGYQVFGCALVAAAMAATATLPGLATVMLVGAMSLMEFWFRRGKTVNAILGVAVAVVGTPASALLANAGLAVMNFADPDPRWRTHRIIAHLSATAWSIAAFVRQPAPAEPWTMIAAAFIVALTITYFRWLNGSHFRLYPLVFPLVCAGLVWDGQWMPAAIGLAGSIVGFLVPRVLAPNVTPHGVHRPSMGVLSTDPPLR